MQATVSSLVLWNLLGTYYETGGSSNNHRLSYSYDEQGRLQSIVERYKSLNFKTEYSYNVKGQVEEITTGNSREKYTYDAYGRLNLCDTYHGSASTSLFTKIIKYKTTGSGGTSNLPNEWIYDLTSGTDIIYRYNYDANGNIISETANGKTTTYVYDSANQLIRENNQAAGKTWIWTYDDAGNIRSKVEFAYTTGALINLLKGTGYSYGNSGWGDLLSSYNGKPIAYDAIGNPLSDGTWSYTWREGRKLATMSNGSITWRYTYDANGSATYNYIYHGSQLTHMTYGDIELHFCYDANEKPLSVTDGGNNTYYYVLNLQGDVVAIVNSSGAQVVSYRYDAYGRILATTGTMASTLGLHNPLRYRGYVYDRETGLYYVSSRYYNPEMGRWINADGYVSTGQDILGYNMFAYCGNNPINRKDSTGQLWITALIVTAVVAVCSVTLSGCSAKPDPAPLPYKTADEAAMAFANSTYSSSSYIRHEYGTVIYSSTTNGTTTYDFATPVAGSPHSVGYGNVKIPSGTTKVATAHTHPNSNNFSGQTPGATSGDIPNAIRRGLDSYVIGPNLNLQKYSISSETVSVVGVASPVALTSQQQATLVSQFQISWDNHLRTCAFGCEHMTWPTP